MDPISITTGVVSLIKVCGTVAFTLKELHDGAQLANSKAEALIYEVEEFGRALNLMKSVLEDGRIRSAFQSTGHIGNHWRNTAACLDDGVQTLNRLQSILEKANKNVTLLSGVRKHMRLRFAADEIAIYQRKIHTVRDTIHLSIQTVTLWNQVTFRHSADEITGIVPTLDELIRSVRILATDMANQMATTETAEELRSLERLQACVRSASEVVSSASTTLGLNDKASIAAASDFADIFPPHPGVTMERWMLDNTLPEESGSAMPLQSIWSTSGADLPADEHDESDSDCEFEIETVNAHWDSAVAAREQKKDKEAIRHLQVGLARLRQNKQFFANISTESAFLVMLLDFHQRAGDWEAARATAMDQLAILSRGTAKEQDSSNDGYLKTIRTLVEILIKLEDTAQARVFAKKCVKGYRRLGAEGLEGLIRCYQLLIRLCKMEDKVEEAQSYELLLTNLSSAESTSDTETLGSSAKTTRQERSAIVTTGKESFTPRNDPPISPGLQKPWVLDKDTITPSDDSFGSSRLQSKPPVLQAPVPPAEDDPHSVTQPLRQSALNPSTPEPLVREVKTSVPKLMVATDASKEEHPYVTTTISQKPVGSPSPSRSIPEPNLESPDPPLSSLLPRLRLPHPSEYASWDREIESNSISPEPQVRNGRLPVPELTLAPDGSDGEELFVATAVSQRTVQVPSPARSVTKLDLVSPESPPSRPRHYSLTEFDHHKIKPVSLNVTARNLKYYVNAVDGLTYYTKPGKTSLHEYIRRSTAQQLCLHLATCTSLAIPNPYDSYHGAPVGSLDLVSTQLIHPLCSSPWSPERDTITLSIADGYYPADSHLSLLGSYEPLAYSDFSQEQCWMSTIHRCPDGKIRCHVKGAIQQVLPRLREDPTISEFTARLSDDASSGMLKICLAWREVPESEYQSRLKEDQAGVSSTGAWTEMPSFSTIPERDLQLLGVIAIEEEIGTKASTEISTLLTTGGTIWGFSINNRETVIRAALRNKITEEGTELVAIDTTTADTTRVCIEQYLTTFRTGSNDTMDKRRVLVISGKASSFALEVDSGRLFFDLTSMCDAVLCYEVTRGQRMLIERRANSLSMGLEPRRRRHSSTASRSSIGGNR